MPALHDWAELARSTFRSLKREDVTGFYRREWPEVRRRLVSQHEAQIEGERRRGKRWIRTANAVVFGLTQRLAPVRRGLFVGALLLAFVDIFAVHIATKNWGIRVGGDRKSTRLNSSHS